MLYEVITLPLLLAVSLLFIAANLGVGLTFSTLARNQLQAVQIVITSYSIHYTKLYE